MQTYLVRLACKSPYLTPWRSSTIWGRLSWIVADGRLSGWDIERWLASYRVGEPPVVVGDAFPFDAVPVPAIHLATSAGPQKKPKSLPWLHWKSVCQSGSWPEVASNALVGRIERMHVVIGRASGTTVEGGLRTESGVQPAEGLIIVAQVDDALGEAGLRTLFDELCKEGWGQGRTTGYGHVELMSITSINRPEPTGSVATLGHSHPTDDLPHDGFWRLAGVPVRRHDSQTRRGPSQEFTAMLQPGASFATDKPWLGTNLETPERPEYMHYGLAPTWPVTGVARA